MAVCFPLYPLASPGSAPLFSPFPHPLDSGHSFPLGSSAPCSPFAGLAPCSRKLMLPSSDATSLERCKPALPFAPVQRSTLLNYAMPARSRLALLPLPFSTGSKALEALRTSP